MWCVYLQFLLCMYHYYHLYFWDSNLICWVKWNRRVVLFTKIITYTIVFIFLVSKIWTFMLLKYNNFLNIYLECGSSSGDPKLNDVHFVNLSLVSELQVKKEVTNVPEVPQSLNLQRVSKVVMSSRFSL